MLNENAQKWVEALRSGEYKQGKRKLCSKTKEGDLEYCCLGVACDLYIKNGNELEVEILNGVVSYNCNSNYLPEEVKEWLGLRTTNAVTLELEDTGYKISLPNENDEGKDFTKIADIIQSEPKGLFK